MGKNLPVTNTFFELLGSDYYYTLVSTTPYDSILVTDGLGPGVGAEEERVVPLLTSTVDPWCNAAMLCLLMSNAMLSDYGHFSNWPCYSSDTLPFSGNKDDYRIAYEQQLTRNNGTYSYEFPSMVPYYPLYFKMRTVGGNRRIYNGQDTILVPAVAQYTELPTGFVDGTYEDLFYMKPVSSLQTPPRKDCAYLFDANPDSLFRLPSADEWNYAACGGRFSHGYRYAGSDVKAEVYQDLGQPVAQLRPNELGIHDMSSGVYELCDNARFSRVDTVMKSYPIYIPISNWPIPNHGESLGSPLAYWVKPSENLVPRIRARIDESPWCQSVNVYLQKTYMPLSYLYVPKRTLSHILREELANELLQDTLNWSENAEKWHQRLVEWGLPERHFMGRQGLLSQPDFICYMYSCMGDNSGENGAFSLSSMQPNVYELEDYQYPSGQNMHLFSGDNGCIGFRVAITHLPHFKDTNFGYGEFVFF